MSFILEISNTLSCIAQEYGWKFENEFTRRNSLYGYTTPQHAAFTLRIKYRRSYKKTLRPISFIHAFPTDKSTEVMIKYPMMRVVIAEEIYEEALSLNCLYDELQGMTELGWVDPGEPYPKGAGLIVDLSNPNCFPVFEKMFERTSTELLPWCKTVIHRHKIAIAEDKKRRKRGKSPRGRKDR